MKYLREFRWRNWSINVRLAITLFLAALIPMSLTAYYNLQGSLKSVKDTAYRNMELVATNTADQIDQLMIDNRYVVKQLGGDASLVRYLSSSPEERSRTRADAAYALQNVLDSNPTYEYAYVVNRDGRTQISRQMEGKPTIERLNVANRAYFTQGMAGNPYIDILVGRTSRLLGLYFSSPVYNENGDILGVVAIKVQAVAIEQIVNTLKVGDKGYAFIVDQDGVVVIHPDSSLLYHSLAPLPRDVEIRAGQRFVLEGCTDAKNLEGCTVPNMGLPKLAGTLSNALAGYTSYDSDHESQIAGFKPMDQLSWVVVVSQPQSEFSAPLNRLATQSALSVVVVGILALIVGLSLARTIARPIKKLAWAAQNVENDRPFSPSDLSDVMQNESEIGDLARVFSAMVMSLRARVNELRTIYEIGTTISSSVDLRPTLYYLMKALSQVIPHDGAEICLYDKKNASMVMQMSIGKDAGQTIATKQSYPIKGYLAQLFERQTLLVEDVHSDETLQEENADRAWQRYKPHAYLGVPLVHKNEVIGTIELVSTQGFTGDNLRILESIAIQAAIAIQNAQEVETREQELKQQIVQLRIEVDEVKKARQVSEIVESEYFQYLQQKAKDLRSRR